MTLARLHHLPTSMRMALIFMLGCVAAFAQQPFNIFILMFFALSGLWLVLQGFLKTWHGYAAGFLFGLGYFLTGLWWIGNALLVEGNPYVWAMPLAVIGLQSYLALYTAIGVGVARHIARRDDINSFLLLVGCLSLSEWLRGHVFTGFPWNSFGSIWADYLPLAQLSSVVGMYGLTFLTILITMMGGFLITLKDKKTKISFLILSILLITLWSGFGFLRIHNNPTIYNKDVVLQVVSPNIPQNEKWDSDLLVRNFLKTTRMIAQTDNQSSSAKQRLIILPESALSPMFLNDTEALDILKKSISAHQEKTYLITGALRKTATDDKPIYHNSLIVMNKSGETLAAFDKFHLVPFGEYIPLQKYIPLAPVVAFSGFQAGSGPETLRVNTIPPFSPLVCYEVIFPGNVTASNDAKWIVNVTNDAWYGFSPGPYQHLAQTRLRAIEEGLPLVRSANTGISAVIDPVGRYIEKSPLFEDHVITSTLPQALKNPTLYSRFGDILFATLVIVAISFGLRRKV